MKLPEIETGLDELMDVPLIGPILFAVKSERPDLDPRLTHLEAGFLQNTNATRMNRLDQQADAAHAAFSLTFAS